MREADDPSDIVPDSGPGKRKINPTEKASGDRGGSTPLPDLQRRKRPKIKDHPNLSTLLLRPRQHLRIQNQRLTLPPWLFLSKTSLRTANTFLTAPPKTALPIIPTSKSPQHYHSNFSLFYPLSRMPMAAALFPSSSAHCATNPVRSQQFGLCLKIGTRPLAIRINIFGRNMKRGGPRFRISMKKNFHLSGESETVLTIRKPWTWHSRVYAISHLST